MNRPQKADRFASVGFSFVGAGLLEGPFIASFAFVSQTQRGRPVTFRILLISELFCDIIRIDQLEFAGEIMIILITGASHTGKTVLAQKLLEKYQYPYLSIDHLKMGLIRSGSTNLTPTSDDSDLTAYLWPIVREIIKTSIENKQNLIVEGCYIPFDWQTDFDSEYLENIKYFCLIMGEEYIRKRFADIKKYANAIENRLDDEYCTMQSVLADNAQMLELAQKYNVNYVLITDTYDIDIDLETTG